MKTPLQELNLKIIPDVPPVGMATLPELTNPTVAQTEELNKRVREIAQSVLVDLALEFHDSGVQVGVTSTLACLTGYLLLSDKETFDKMDIRDALDFAKCEMERV